MRRESLLSIFSFATTLSINFLIFRFLFQIFSHLYWFIVLNSLFALVLAWRTPTSGIVSRAGGLGSVFGFGLLAYLASDSSSALSLFYLYLMVISFFHWSEYVCTSLTNPDALNLDSFLLNHSTEYWIALVAGWAEFFLELYLFPTWKSYRAIGAIGLMICIIGDTLRIWAMVTAGRSFTHLIAFRKRDEHNLVTSGVYSLFRHPSYVGWFWWSIGTQVLLCNPICTCAYAVVSWTFFNDRIYHEEITLINFFGENYVNYQRRVPTGLPGIKGYQPF